LDCNMLRSLVTLTSTIANSWAIDHIKILHNNEL